MGVTMWLIHFVWDTSYGFDDFIWSLKSAISNNSKLKMNNLIISVQNTSKMLKIRHTILYVLNYGQNCLVCRSL